jgi:hypothetical protein
VCVCGCVTSVIQIDTTKLLVAVSNFAKAPKNEETLSSVSLVVLLILILKFLNFPILHKIIIETTMHFAFLLIRHVVCVW